jgi:hypothetical protein
MQCIEVIISPLISSRDYFFDGLFDEFIHWSHVDNFAEEKLVPTSTTEPKGKHCIEDCSAQRFQECYWQN